MTFSVFRIRVFFQIRIELFFLSPDPDPWKKRPNTVSTCTGQSRKFVYFIFSTLNTVLYGPFPPTPNQNHHLDLLGLLMEGSGSRLLKPDPDQLKNPDPSGSGKLLCKRLWIRIQSRSESETVKTSTGKQIYHVGIFVP